MPKQKVQASMRARGRERTSAFFCVGTIFFFHLSFSANFLWQMQASTLTFESVVVYLGVCMHVSVPCAAELIHLCQTGTHTHTQTRSNKANLSSLRIWKAKQTSVKNIYVCIHIYMYACKYTYLHTHTYANNRHILFVLSYQHTRTAKQGQMQLFAQSATAVATATATANSALAKKRSTQKAQNKWLLAAQMPCRHLN